MSKSFVEDIGKSNVLTDLYFSVRCSVQRNVHPIKRKTFPAAASATAAPPPHLW